MQMQKNASLFVNIVKFVPNILMSPRFMVVTIAKHTFCSKKVTVIKLIGRVIYDVYDWPIQISPKNNTITDGGSTAPLYC